MATKKRKAVKRKVTGRTSKGRVKKGYRLTKGGRVVKARPRRR